LARIIRRLELLFVNYPAIHTSFYQEFLRNQPACGIDGLQANSWGESCGGISSEPPPVGVVNGDDAQILDPHCAANTTMRKNTDDNYYYA
jgi:hypothetical protein